MRIRFKTRKQKTSPQLSVVAAFACTILLGALFLALPIANTNGQWNLSTTPLFLATSATCVTGLDPVGIGSALTHFGLAVMLILVELGGIGVMTIGTFFFLMIGKRLSLSEERVIMNTLGEGAISGIREIIGKTLSFTFFWEFIGTVLLAWRLQHTHGYTWGSAIHNGLFMSVMTFCNAGFSTDPMSMYTYAEDPFMMLTTTGLMLIGGIGFIVHANVLSHYALHKPKNMRKRISLHSHLVLKTTGIILLVCTLLFLALEWSNAFADFSTIDKIIGSLFQTATSRTTGFAGVPTNQLRDASILITMLVMFVGAAPGSTGGGIKVTTLAVLFSTMRCFISKHQSTEVSYRSIPNRIVKDAISITILSILVIIVSLILISITEEQSDLSLLNLAFEVVSAYTTTGLSLGATALLSPWGKLLIIVCMFIGRLGPMTLAVTLSRSQAGPAKRYPEENVIVG